MPIGYISQHSGLSKRYLDQLAIALKNASLVRSHSGRGGGYTLSRPASQIRIDEILAAAIGPISIADCLENPDLCMKSEFCGCRLLWELINRRIVGILSEYSLSDLMHESWEKKIKNELTESESEEERRD